MKSIKLIIALTMAFLPFLSVAQTDSGEGIRFETALNWKQIQAKAKAENKYIFMDCFATWCGPCKYMDKAIFPQKETGDFFNAHFINVRVQMDATPKDDQHTRDWYADVMTLQGQYQVQSYPCYLFFSPDGVLVHRLSGSRQKPQDFISDASDALDVKKQYYGMLAREPEFKNDSLALLHALKTAMAIRDEKGIALLAPDYLNVKKDFSTKDDIKFIENLIALDKASRNHLMSYLISNGPRIDMIMGDKHWVERNVTKRIYEIDVEPYFVNDVSPIDWDRIRNDLQKKYATLNPDFVDHYMGSYFQQDVGNEIKFLFNIQESTSLNWEKIFLSLQTRFPNYPDLEKTFLIDKAFFCEDHNLWSDCTDAIYTLLKNDGSKLSAETINNICWFYVFLHTDDKKVLKEALKCQKLMLDKCTGNESLYDGWIDTYANLLYKTDNQQEALIWEQKALDIVTKQQNEHRVNEYKEVMEKMRKGEKTWVGVQNNHNYLR